MRAFPALSIRNILLVAISVLTLLVGSFALHASYVGWQRMLKTQSLREATLLGDKLFDVASKLSVERETTFSMLYASDPNVLRHQLIDLDSNRKQSDAALETALQAIEERRGAEISSQVGESRRQLRMLQDMRRKVDEAMVLPAGKRDEALPDEWFQASTALILQTQNTWMAFIQPFVDVDPVTTLHMRLKHVLEIIMEYTGRERSIIGGLIAGNTKATPKKQAQLLRWQGASELAWNLSGLLATQGRLGPLIGPLLKDAQSQYSNGYNMVSDIFYIPGAEQTPPYPIGIDLWLELSGGETESLYDLKEAALKETQSHVLSLLQEAQRSIMTHLALAFLAFGLCGVIFQVVTRRVIHPITSMADALLSASEGKPVNFESPVEHRHDEIGKLARVLQAFQKNVDEIKRSSAALERYSLDLERTNKELDQFVYVASHDLKAPLRGIDNLAAWIIEDAGESLTPDIHHKINLLRGRVSRLEALLASILAYSRAGRIVENAEEADLGELVKNVAEMHVPPSFTVDIKELPVIKTPRMALEQIFGNIFTNAVKHHDMKGGNITVSALEKGEYWEFVVTDDGPGIPPEYHEKVFEMFRTLKPRDVVEGSGLGMAIIKKLVEWRRGKVWVVSVKGQRGTAIHFLWPKKFENLSQQLAAAGQ